jgi:hypothetical protein
VTAPVRTFIDSRAVKEEGGTPPPSRPSVPFHEPPERPKPPDPVILGVATGRTMTVAELIAALAKAPPDLEIQTEGCDCDGDCAVVAIVHGFGLYLQRDKPRSEP